MSGSGPIYEYQREVTARLEQALRERDEARAELDFIKAEYGGADDDSLTRDALLLKLRLLESEMDGERASRRVYERAHDDILAALKRAGADAYHPEDGEPVALWGVERLAKQRDEARFEVDHWKGAAREHAENLAEARAEVERMKHQLGQEHSKRIAWMSCLNCGTTRAEGDFWDGACPACPSEDQRQEASAYQRGAEAMREAAASCVGSDTALLQTYRSVLEGRIRDLPVPEDKP